MNRSSYNNVQKIIHLGVDREKKTIPGADCW